MTMKSVFVCLGLSLCVACGGSDGANGNTAGSSGSGNPGAGSGNPGAGSGNPGAGSGNPGAGSGGSGPSAGGAPATNSGTFSSGLSGDKQLGSLTDDESAALCKKLSEYFADGGAVSKNFQEVTCRVTGVFFAAIFGGMSTDAALQASCKSTYDACVAAPTTSSESCKKPDASCTATTSEYEACVNDSIKQIGQLGTAVPTCDKLTVASAGALFAGGSASESPASCQAVSAKCPDAPTSGVFSPSGPADSDP